MAIFKPTDCSPFNGTFDISENSADLPIIFECKVDTSNTIVTGYSIEIYDSNNELVFPSENREIGPVESNVTYLSDLKPYVINNFSSLIPNMRNINSGLNGTYLEIPFYVNSMDSTAGSTVSRNQMSSGLVEGQTYTWKITLYQEVKKDGDFPPKEEKYYDMTVTSGTIIGSNEKRIQTALIDSDDQVVDNLVLIDKFIQPIKIDSFNSAPDEPKKWSGTIPTTFSMARSLITGYDSTYGYIYPSTAADNAFTEGQIIPENANGFQIFKNGNNPSNLGATDIVELVYNSNSFKGDNMTWKSSAVDSGQSYWEQVYPAENDSNGFYFPLSGDGYSTYSFSGGERVIFNNIQESDVYINGKYYGSPFNGIFSPRFSTKSISTSGNTISAGTYIFEEIISLKELSSVSLNFKIKLESDIYEDCTGIRVDIGSLYYQGKEAEFSVYRPGTRWIKKEYKTIIVESDQEVSSDFFDWFSQNIHKTVVTVIWNRTTDASNWGTLSNKIVYNQQDGKNYEINTVKQIGEINKTPFKFVEEKPVRIFNTTKTQNNISALAVEEIGVSNKYIISTDYPISSLASVFLIKDGKNIDITKDCIYEIGEPEIIFSPSEEQSDPLSITVNYTPYNEKDYAGVIFYNQKPNTNSSGYLYIRPSINIGKNIIFKEVTTTANPTWFNINYFNKDYNYIKYETGSGNLNKTTFNPIIDKTRYQIKSFYKDSDYNPFSIYKDPTIVSTISGNVIESGGFENNIITRNFTVTSTYDQNNYIQWKSYQWFLYDSAKRTILEKTDERYDGEITATFYGLDPQKYYILSLVLQTNTGKIIEIDYVIYTDFTESAEQKDLVEAEFDCDTLAMKANLKLVNTVFAPDADEYLSGSSGSTAPTKDTVYYYDQDNFYKKDGEVIASIDSGTGVLKITGQNALNYSKSFSDYAIDSSTRTESIQTSSDEIVIEGAFTFSEDYNGNIFSISRDDNTNATVEISIPQAIQNIDSEGFVNLANDIDKIKIKNGSYLKVVDESGILSNIWQNSNEFHNTSIWKKADQIPSGDRINVANFKYAEIKNKDGSYSNSYLNVSGPYNSYDSEESLKNPINPRQQLFNINTKDRDAFRCNKTKDNPNGVAFNINQPDKLIWLDYTPTENQKSVVIDADENGALTQSMTVMENTLLYWPSEDKEEKTKWKDGIYIESGLEKTLIGQIFVNDEVVKSEYLDAVTPVNYSKSGLTQQIQVSQNIKERKAITNYEFTFRIFVNTNNFSVDQLRSRCYVKDISTPVQTYNIVENLTNVTANTSNPKVIKENQTVTLKYAVDNEYQFPSSVTVENCTIVSWSYNSNIGTLIIKDPTGDVNVTIAGNVVVYNIVEHLTNVIKVGTHPTTIATNQTIALVYAAAAGYNLPDVVRITGATNDWKRPTGTLTLTNPTGTVMIEIAGTLPKLDTPTGVSITGDTLTFNEVENAEQYEVFAGDASLGIYIV